MALTWRPRLVSIALAALVAFGCASGQTGSPACAKSCACGMLKNGFGLLRATVIDIDGDATVFRVDEVFSEAEVGSFSPGDEIRGEVGEHPFCRIGESVPPPFGVGDSMLVSCTNGKCTTMAVVRWENPLLLPPNAALPVSELPKMLDWNGMACERRFSEPCGDDTIESGCTVRGSDAPSSGPAGVVALLIALGGMVRRRLRAGAEARS